MLSASFPTGDAPPRTEEISTKESTIPRQAVQALNEAILLQINERLYQAKMITETMYTSAKCQIAGKSFARS